jgi:F-type H+-transporting ATPase subunit b
MNQGFIFLLNATCIECAGAVPRLFDLDAQTFYQMVPPLINFIVLAVVLTLILYKPVRKFLYERASRIARELDDAEATRAAASALKDQYEQRLKDIELERTAILDDARKQAMERRNRDIAEVKKEIEALKARADIEIAAEKNRVKELVEHAIVDLSCEMASKLLKVTVDPSIHNRLFDEAMLELEATVWRT